MNTERERLINWAKHLADPNWCLYVPKEAKDVMTQLVTELEAQKVPGISYPEGYVPSEHVEEVCCKGIVLCEECLSCGDQEASL